MKQHEVIDASLVQDLSDVAAVGVDIGSRAAKAVLLADGQLFTAIVATGVNAQATADELLDELFEAAERPRDAVEYIVGTGYGRVALNCAPSPRKLSPRFRAMPWGLISSTRTPGPSSTSAARIPK